MWQNSVRMWQVFWSFTTKLVVHLLLSWLKISLLPVVVQEQQSATQFPRSSPHFPKTLPNQMPVAPSPLPPQDGVENWRHKKGLKRWIEIKTIYWKQQWDINPDSNNNNRSIQKEGDLHAEVLTDWPDLVWPWDIEQWWMDPHANCFPGCKSLPPSLKWECLSPAPGGMDKQPRHAPKAPGSPPTATAKIFTLSWLKTRTLPNRCQRWWLIFRPRTKKHIMACIYFFQLLIPNILCFILLKWMMHVHLYILTKTLSVALCIRCQIRHLQLALKPPVLYIEVHESIISVLHITKKLSKMKATVMPKSKRQCQIP